MAGFQPPKFLRTLCLFLLLLLPAGAGQSAAGAVTGSEAAAGRQILVLNSFQSGLPVPDSMDRGIVTALLEGGVSAGDIFCEHLDLARDPGSGHRASLFNLLRHKFAGKGIAVVITIGAPATDLMAKEGKSLFGDAVVLTLVSPNYRQLSDVYSHVLNIPWQLDPAGTLRIALGLFPQTKRVLMVTGARDSVFPFLDQARQALAPWQGKLLIEYSNEMSYEEMLRRVATLPKNSIVLYSPFFNDSTGRAFVPAEVVAKLCQIAEVPVFSMMEQYLGQGVVGGSVLRTEDIGRKAGKVTLDYLHGRLKLTAKLTTFQTAKLAELDWRQLKRWNAEQSSLPAETVFLNRPPTLWGQYRLAVIVAAAVIAVMALLIGALVALNRHLKRLTVAANDSEARFRVMVEYAPEAILVYDVDLMRVVDANAKAEQLFGCSMDRLLQGGAERIYPLAEPQGMSSASVSEQNEAILAGAEAIFERAVKSDDGRKLTCEVRLVRLPYREQRLLRAGFIDITQRKRTADVLKASEERFRTLVNTIPDLIWLKDADGVYLTCNTVFELFFGAKEADIAGKTDYDFVDRKLADFFRQHDRMAMAAGKPTSNEEEVVFAVDGRRATLYTTKTPMYDSEGKLIGVLGIGRDISELRRNEEERSKLEGQLHQIQKIESVGRLAGGVAHDFNNMLSVIIGHTDLALLEGEPAQSFGENLREIRKAAERSADLTRQLLAFARKQTIAPKVLDLNETVAGMLKMLQRLMGEDINLVWHPAADLWPVKVDASQIDQILANLCVNARDSIAGVGKIIIETANRVIDADFLARHADAKPGEYLALAVSDSGCGMDGEILAHIFEPFYTTKGLGKGTGLGLSTVFGAVRQNQGFITVYSEPGLGTTFTIYLPRHDGRIVQPPSQSAEEPVPNGHETILLVEDEPAILEMTGLILTRQGYVVLQASTPAEAIHLAREHAGEIDLLITDVVLPQMNGKDLADNLKSLTPQLKCLYMSGYTADAIAQHGVLDDGVEFIQKPFSLQLMSRKVREVLDGSRAGQAGTPL
jgi:PAS domain S-box-containing protein